MFFVRKKLKSARARKLVFQTNLRAPGPKKRPKNATMTTNFKIFHGLMVYHKPSPPISEPYAPQLYSRKRIFRSDTSETRYCNFVEVHFWKNCIFWPPKMTFFFEKLWFYGLLSTFKVIQDRNLSINRTL